MKVAVTGISGYLGQLIAPRLDAAPDVDAILGLDRVPPQHQSPKMTFASVDVRTADFATLLRGCDAVIHLAFIVQPPRRMPMAAIDEINVEGSRRVFAGAVAAGVGRIVCASSVAAYGAHPDNPEPLTEDSPLRPNDDWYYSRAKGKVEAILDEVQAGSPGTAIVRLRPVIFLGPTINNMLGQQFSAKTLVSFDRGTRINFCWDDDVAAAFVLALRHSKSDAFNITGDGALSGDDMGRLAGRRVIHLPRGLALGAARTALALGLINEGDFEWAKIATGASIVVSAEKAKRVLGWKPQFDTAGAYVEFIRRRKGP